MIPEIPEYEQERRVKEMMDDPHIRETLHQTDDLKEEYPDVKIINVNPVALKGMMDEDIYT